MRRFGKYVVFLQITILVFGTILISLPTQTAAATTKVKDEYKVSEGIQYKDIRMENGKLKQAIRVMKIDVANPEASVEVGVSSELNQLQRTSSLAIANSTKDSWTAGAINASFFWAGTPMNLVSKDNRLVHAGEVYENEKDKYVNEPIAFGIDKNGKGLIDYYQLHMTYIHNGNTYPITATNEVRSTNETILYTAAYPSETTKTNVYGTEIVVTLPSAPQLEFGQDMTGTVVSIREEGDETKTTIPENGFVLSGNELGSDNLKNIQIGDQITLSVDVDDKWVNSEFMLASGPMLVKDGKVSMTMNPNSVNASQRAPRTAVALDKTGAKVFFVTVDGRQAGYSNGMTLTEFAKYLVEMGADRALNLDGGGSTTMAARLPGTDFLEVVNSLSDGSERAVSTIIMAKSTAPMQIFADVANNHWASSAITDLFKRGTVTGFPGGEFRPSASITRTQAAIMLARQLGLDTGSIEDPGFTDVDLDYKYYPEIAAAENADLFKGRSGGLFVPNGILTRGEMAVLLQRAYGIAEASKGYFPDVPSKHYAYDAVNAMAESGLTSGYPDGSFKPDQPVSRAEFSAFLERVQPAASFLRVNDLGNSSLNVRSSATTNSDVIGQLNSFDNVTVLIDGSGNLVKSGDWYKILYKGKRAWIHSDYVN